jgi:hypothetical protein
MSAADISSPLYLAEILQMEGSVKPRLSPTAAFFKPKASQSADDAFRTFLAPRRGPITGEFSVIKTT